MLVFGSQSFAVLPVESARVNWPAGGPSEENRARRRDGGATKLLVSSGLVTTLAVQIAFGLCAADGLQLPTQRATRLNHRAAKPVFGAIILFLSALACDAATPLAEFRSHILLNPDSSAVIIEHLRPAAPGPVERRIRVRSSGVLGRDRLHVDILEVTDGGGQPLRYHARTRGDFLAIASVAAGELKLIYAVRNAIQPRGTHDEFLWAATPSDVAVQSAFVRVALPPEAAGQFSAQAVLRREREGIASANLWSSDGRIPLRVDKSEIETGSPGPLAAGVVLTVDVVAEKGTFEPIPVGTRAWWFAANNPIVLLPLVVLGLMLLLRRIKGGNPDAGRSVAPMYAPPEGLTPAEAGTLIDDRLDPRDITATLMDLAVRGYVRIEPCEPEQNGAEGRDFVLRLLRPREEWNELAPHEETMLFHTFYGGQWTKLSSLRLRFPEIVPWMRRQILGALREKGMYRVDPVEAHRWRQAGLYVLGGGLLLVQKLGGVALFDSPWLALAMIAVSSVIVYLLGRNMTAKTLRGMRNYVALLGLQEFIETVDADRLERLDRVGFEKLLPYAIALGIEQRWAHDFRGIATTPPEWFAWAGEQPFDPTMFGKLLGGFATGPALHPGPRGRVVKPSPSVIAVSRSA